MSPHKPAATAFIVVAVLPRTGGSMREVSHLSSVTASWIDGVVSTIGLYDPKVYPKTRLDSASATP
jgi:hypothetical protein